MKNQILKEPGPRGPLLNQSIFHKNIPVPYFRHWATHTVLGRRRTEPGNFSRSRMEGQAPAPP